MHIEKTPVILPFIKQPTVSEDYDLITRPMKTGHIFIIEKITARNPVSNNLMVHVGVQRGSTITWVNTLDLGDKDRYYALSGPITIPSDYRIILRFISAVAGRKLEASVFGYFEVRVE